MKTDQNIGVEPALATDNLSHSFGELEVLKPVDLRIGRGEFVSVLGPSGCGKSTLLSILTGLLPLRGGSYTVEGSSMVVFQQDGLLPWRTVRANVELGLEYRKIPRKERRQKAGALLAQVGLEGFEDRYPSELSGGMRQRTSIARALAVDPEILFLDEPFGALDALTRLKMQNDLLSLWEGSGKTVLMVTHDIDEAIKLSDRILVFSDRPGRIIADERVEQSRHHRMSGEIYQKLRQRLLDLLEPREYQI